MIDCISYIFDVFSAVPVNHKLCERHGANMSCYWLVLSCAWLCPPPSLPLRVLSFSPDRALGSGAMLDYHTLYQEHDLTICLDIFVTAITAGHINLISSDQFTLSIPSPQDKLLLEWKGIWYWAFNVPSIEPFTWTTVCFSYTVSTHTVRLAYRGGIYLARTDPQLLGLSTVQDTFLKNIILGRKDNTGTFIGKMSRFSVRDSADSDKTLEDDTKCLSRTRNTYLGNIAKLSPS